MNGKEIQASQIRTLLLELIDQVAPGCVPDDVDDEEDIREQMDLDSMDILNIVAALHERTGIDVPESDVDQMVTIAGAVAYLSPFEFPGD